MSYCGVGDHHQNGRVKKLIRDIQDHGRTVLLHAQQRWPDVVCENLWPYAFALCVEIRKWTPRSLSTMEAEFIALSEGLGSTIPLIGLVTEFREKGVPMQLCKPKIHCRVFEDNNGAIELAKCQKYRPHTKHINIKYWHFMDYVMRYNIEILPIDTKEQLADIFTKPLPQETFERLRDKVQGID